MAYAVDATVVEISYEVANKVGGIYTVLASKAENMIKNIKDYYVIGPYYEKSAAVEFEEAQPSEEMKKVFGSLKEKGITCRFGKWLIEGKPRCILIDPGSLKESTNDIKKEMWEKFHVDSLNADWWYDEPLPWSRAAGIVVEELHKAGIFNEKTIAHFHEWLCGAGLLYLKKNKKIKTVFTTHSTVLGRTIAELGKEDLYALIDDGLKKKQAVSDAKAVEYKCEAKHTMEKATAQNADVFTTVSQTVAPECEYILGRKPDVKLPNGLNMNRFPLMEDLSSRHIHLRNRVRHFLMSYFSPYYEFDAKNTLVYFISGRFEFHNKGIDVFIDALGRLNQRLKAVNNKKQIVVFIWVPERTMERKRNVLENLALFEHAEEVVKEEGERIRGRIMKSFARGELPQKTKIFDDKFLEDMKRMELLLKSKHDQIPPVTPFDLFSENLITEALKRNSLLNRKEDKVKIIYYPAYLSTTDGLLGMNYYDAMIACHVGVFPSYYESWGYTPLEAAALGLQSITTDMSGFGKFISPKLGKHDMSIVVLKRQDISYHDVVDNLTDIMFGIYQMTKKQRGQCKMQAKHLSMLADWEVLIKEYIKAYDLALKK
ncbi:MAG: glycogen/starch synthase [Candidatus Aenigmarchaeota archaeon]|nr:glycogen/starch synthase [Candidatus Aenigmarchaeota archaeon]